MPPDQEYDIEAMSSSINLGLDEGVEKEEFAPSTPAGGDGEDTLTAGEGDDTVAGGEGQDTVEGADTVAGAGAQDIPVPSSWKPETHALWAGASHELKAQIAQREADFHAGIAQYKESATFGDAFRTIYQPYQDLLDANGMTAPQVTQNLLQAQITLAYGKPEEKVALIKGLLTDYEITPEQLGIQVGEPSAEVAGLRETVTRLNSRLDQLNRFVDAQQQTTLRSQVTAFLSNPKFEHASALTKEIGQLLQADKSLTLEQAYEKAIWLNPDVRAKHMAALATKQQADAAEAARKKAADAAAAKGARSPQFQRRQSAKPAESSSLDRMSDTILEDLQAIQSRKS